MPLAFYAAARALPTLKNGYSLVRRWNSLPPQERDEMQEQGRRAVLAIMALKVAVAAERSAVDPPATWEEALKRALSPAPAEEMAKAVVAYLQRVAEATAQEIARAVGAAGKDDSTFQRAMEIARADSYIRRAGVNFQGVKWDTTEWADLQLVDSPHVRRLEAEITAFLERVGIASLDHISGELGLESEAAELMAAMECAILGESAVWYCNGVYGLPSSRLEGFEADRDLWAETSPVAADKDPRSAIAELQSAVAGLASAMKASGPEAGAARELVAGEGPGGDGEDPYERLRRLQELHDAGVLTADEFSAKKTELLRRI